MPNWFDKTDEEIIQRLKNVLRTEDFQFIGKYKPVPQKDFGFFKDVRSLSGVRKFYPTDEGLPDENKIRPLEIYTKSKLKFDKNKEIQLLEGKWYKFYSVPAGEPLRVSKRNPFLLQADFKRVKDIVGLKGHELIENIRKDSVNTPESTAGKLKNAIETISIDINTEPTTFIFELIQNADDYPNTENNVSISFEINNSHLIIKHNGSPFEVNNTVALCGINDGDKREDKNKIGFKGIGFKSIFKDANFAYIKSGDYSFRFDEEFWTRQGIEMFWHITPINTPFNEFSQILKVASNVNIVIRPIASQVLRTYREIFIKHFNDERILLFLRNVKSLIFDSAEDKFEISNSSSKWKIFTESNVEIPEKETNELNRRINFPDKRIPVKFHDITLTELGFGFRINQNKVESIGDGFIYAYLPTKVNLGFSFIVNGNFIPDASRTKIYSDLTWNYFLFEKAGELFIKQITALLTQGLDKGSVINQIPSFPEILLNIRDDDKIIFINCFKRGFEKEILNQHFIPTQSGTLETLSNILIDETGLTDLLKEDFFKLTGITGKLIHNEVGEGGEKVKALIAEYKQGTVYGIDDLKYTLKTPLFQEWLKNPINNFKLIQHFNSVKELKNLLVKEEIILSESKQLCKSDSLFISVPNEITFTTVKKIDSELLSLLNQHEISLELTKFEPAQFFKDNILGNQKNINASLTDETNLLNFWKFVFDNWTLFENETTIKDSLKNFEVLCKSKTENELSKKIISSVYLSAEFNSANEIESVIKDISPSAVFISEKYIDKKREAEKWRPIFKQAGTITDLQKVIEVLLPNLPTIEAAKHLEIAKQIFKFWRDPANKLTEAQISLIKTNLKIKCHDKEFRKSTDCFISDHYNNNQLIASWLPDIELTNQVEQEYAPKTNQVAEWKNFLVLIGCVELSDKQNVFDAKLNFLIDAQDKLKEKHFEIVKSISELYKARNENGLDFDIENRLSKIQLKTTDNEFRLPNDIHLSSKYNPKLNLENDEEIGKEIHFLSNEYFENQMPTKFLTRIGVNDTFKFRPVSERIYIDKFINKNYLSAFLSMKSYIDRYNVISRSYTSQQIRNVTSIRNHVSLNYDFVYMSQKYLPLFWDFILKDKTALNKLAVKTELRIWENNIYPNDNYVLNQIKANETVLAGGTYKRPTALYSQKLIPYIENSSEYSEIDFSNIYVDEEKIISLEELIGIQQKLSPRHCLSLLSKDIISLSENEIKELNIVDILTAHIPKPEELTDLKLPNKLYQWKPLNELFILTDEQFQIEPTQYLHEDFHSIADNFGIQKLSEDNLVLKTKPKMPTVTDEIETFFKSKAKFIAFKIDHSNYEEVEAGIIEKIIPFEFYEVTSIAKVFPEVNPIYKSESIDFLFFENEKKIIYKGNWKKNNNIIDFLFQQIQSVRIERVWFENVINRWDDDKIIEKLNEEVGTTPSEWNSSRQTENGENKKTFLDEVNDYIDSMREIEEIYDEEKVEELKTILAAFKDQPDGKRKAFNLLAKLKLCKRIGLNYDNNWEFNKVDTGNERYFIHSARGSFAYIHPNEILQMRDEGFKMAIDFGTHDIRIYNSHSDIIELYQNYLMLYQGKPSEDDILSICEDNQDKAKFHFLIVDREKQTNDALAILKILNTDSYE